MKNKNKRKQIIEKKSNFKKLLKRSKFKETT